MGDRNNKPPDNPWFKNLSQLAGPSTRSNAAGSSRSNAAGPSRSYVAGSSRPVAAGSSRLIPAGSSKPNAGELPEKFLKASAQMMKSASKYAHSFESSSDEEDLQEDSILSSIMKEYSSEGKDKSYDRTREFLEQSFQSGATVCLICIASVKRIQPIWSCEVCYTALHLPCLQRWANGTVQHQTEPIDPLLSDTIIRMRPTRNIEWCCPKCRTSYSKEQIPNFYMCFCKQKRNPEYQPWLIPHSCGATCDKPLIPDCGHNCLLLCHPGACPPCPKMIIIECYCEKNPAKPIRCNMKGWSCDKICNKLLSCCTHKCELQCHSGPCYACVKTTLQFCRCQKSESARPCESLEWICGMPCDKKFSCGFHLCEKICHEGPCGNCPYTGIQKCPCGCFQMEVSCPDVVVPCGSTCNKVLPCFEHHCPNKCHRGPCDQL